ncbi:waprin-Rha1 [Macrosteles quadrilineatus]|uniref:waprin-Rha1 n=1 Tax=Macrosteles quadrilineatus TaxID=74068 RepID=UPI0023E0B2A9|nr:waprin-Rha1 [Macrosteles quadrilineatus]
MFVPYVILICFVFITVEAQYKGGDCPPALPVGVCYPSCGGDGDCEGFYKCCPTSCGGSVCSRPVTARRLATLKNGVCPQAPTGPWVCSDRCSTDADCRGRNKCCRNRCGALACIPPQQY